ncbi:MAG: M1 family metallopeptidase [Actinomycetota bacterium]
MKRLRDLLSITLALTFLIPSPTTTAAASAKAGGPATSVIRNPGAPSYVVSLRGDSVGHVWRGRESITFTNLETEPLTTIWLRLWSNGVKGCGAHAIAVAQMQGGTAGDLSKRCTTLPVDLDAPVAQGGQATISMRVTIDLPKKNDRFGYHGGVALLGTALPTIAVHDDLGWHLDPFVDLGESFYSIVGDYRVNLNVPTVLRTPTTGTAVASRIDGARRVTTYVAHDVRDFEWAAARFATVRGHSGGTEVVVSYRSHDMTRRAAKEALGYSVSSLDAYSEGFGTFPYPEMDIVLTGFTAFGGMEYPTLIFTNPGKITIAHELGHQYWYGIVGDDQFSSPWLDESFATWTSYLPFGGWKKCASYHWPSSGARITNDMGYWMAHQSEYDTIYGGGGCLLANLADLFGLDRFVEVLHDYAQDHWFGVTRTEDFKAAIEAAATADGLAFDPAAYWDHWRVD